MVFNGLRIPRACTWYSGIYTLLKIRRIMMVQEKEKGKGKINEALEILEEAAKDKKEELNKLVGSGYANVRELFAEGLKKSSQAQEKLGDAVSDGEKIVEETIQKGSMYVQDATNQLEKRSATSQCCI